METFRDTAFGKIVRLLSGQRLMRYPEEKDHSFCLYYLDDATARAEIGTGPEEGGTFGVYTVMSQASRASGDLESSPTTTTPMGQNKRRASANAEKQLLIGWIDENDPEVSITSCC